MKYVDPDGRIVINAAAAIGGTVIGGILGAATAYAAGCDKNQIIAAAVGGATITGATSAVVDGVIQVANVANGRSDATSLDTRSMAAAGVSGFASSIVTGGLLKTPALANQPCGNVVANVVGANVGGEISTGLKNSRNGEPIIQKDQQATNYLYSTAGGIVTSALSNPTINSIGKGVLQGFKENMGAAATQEYLKEKIGNE